MRKITYLFIFMLFTGLGLLQAQVVVYNDTVCDTESYGVLRANISALLSNGYVTDSIPFNYDSDFTNANDVLLENIPLDIDDVYSDPIDIGFTFYFFGEPYDKLVIGTNGDIIFQPHLTGTFDSYFLFDYQLIPNIELPYYDWWGVSYASIMGAFHDMDAEERNDMSEIKYEVRGQAPNRQFIITYHEIPQFWCWEQSTSQQIVLNENGYSIEVHMKHKPVCDDWNDGLAVLGIQNDDATCGAYPGDESTEHSMVNRNTSVWAIDSLDNPEAWIFRPDDSPEHYTITWYDADRNPVPNSNTSELRVPMDSYNGPYTCQVTYYDCAGNETIAYDEGEIKVVPSPVVDLGNDFYRCKDDEIVLDATPKNMSDFQNANDLSYQWYRNGHLISGANGPHYQVTAEGTYAVEVTHGNCTTRDEIVITDYINSACIIPEAITPNNDSKNDAFILDFLNAREGIDKVQIFNRWGAVVFEKENGYVDEWHGQNKNGDPLPAATYYYVIKLKDGSVKTGWVYLIK